MVAFLPVVSCTLPIAETLSCLLPANFGVHFRKSTLDSHGEGERASKDYCCVYYSYVELFSSFALGLSVNSHDAPLRSCEFFASIAASHILLWTHSTTTLEYQFSYIISRDDVRRARFGSVLLGSLDNHVLMFYWRR